MHKKQRSKREQRGMGMTEPPCAPIKMRMRRKRGREDRGAAKRTRRGKEQCRATTKDVTVNTCHATSTLYAAPGKVNEAYRAVALPLICYVLSHQSLEFTKRPDDSETRTTAERMGIAWLCWLPACACDADVNNNTSSALQKI